MSTDETNQTSRPETAYVVFTTHWDREWVQTFEQYRYRLVNLIDGLLDILQREPGIKFFFDGQTVFLEDYLEIRPENKAILQERGNEGRLIVGPWYVLADQFLEGAEATVRNLLIGRKTAAEFGGAASVGYVPDSFGSIASLPAILNGFGIRAANFGRGRAHLTDADGPLFWWQGKDGSRVLALNRGYGNAVGLSYPDLWRDIERCLPTVETARSAAEWLLEGERRNAHVPLYYLSVGIDHMEMRPGMAGIVAALNAGQTRTQFVVSDPQRYLEEAEKYVERQGIALKVVEGEMRGDGDSPMDLQGVLSTNQAVKRDNRRCEVLLSGIVEPLAAIAQALGGASSEHHVAHAWKTLLKNHPHDSICACSTDSVIADVLARFRSVTELAEILVERTLRRLVTPREGEADPAAPSLTLYNPTPERHVSDFGMRVRLPRRLEGDKYLLVAADGEVVGEARRVAIKNVDLESVYATNGRLGALLSKDSPEGRDPDECYTVLDVAGACDFGAALGFRTLALVPDDGNLTRPPSDVIVEGRSVSNGQIRLSAAGDGTLELEDLVRGETYSGLGWFEDTADIGDTYDYGALDGDVPATTRGKKAVSITTRLVSAFVAEMEVTVELPIPEDSSPNGRGLGRPQELVTVYQIVAGASRVSARTRYVNDAVHHRLRVAFRFGDTPRVLTGGHFAAVERGWTTLTERFPCRPFTDYVHLAGREGGFGIWSRGLYECELQAAGGGRDVYVTLCRSVTTIGPAAGANYEVSHAQERGPHTVEYAFGPSSSLADTVHQAAAYVCPVIGEAHPAAKAPAATLGSILSVSPADVVFTCLKRAADGDGTIVRVFNLSALETPVSMTYSLPFSSARRVDLSESDVPAEGPIHREGAMLGFVIGPHETATFRLVDDDLS